MKTRTLLAITPALIILSVTACGDAAETGSTRTDTSVSTVAPEADVVTITDSRFDQLELRVEAGTTVTFVNTDAFDHTVTSGDGSPVEFDSGDLGQDGRFELTFDEPGEYPYFCRIHPTMRAVVIVG